MKRRKKKWPKGMKPKLHQGGVLNESQKLSMDDVIPKIELAGRTFTTRLVDVNDPHNLAVFDITPAATITDFGDVIGGVVDGTGDELAEFYGS